MVKSAETVEVIIGTRQLLIIPVEAVVNDGEDCMLSRRQGACRNLQLCIRIWMDAEIASVNHELSREAHPVDDKPGVLHRRVYSECAAVKPRAALAQPLRQHVVAARDGNHIRRFERRIRDLAIGFAFLEAELPASVKRNIRKKNPRRAHTREP